MADKTFTDLAKAVQNVSRQSTTRVVQLPVWPKDNRGIPNSVLRSALFAVIRRGRRAMLWKEKITAQQGIVITYSGYRLDQADLDVWEQCLQLQQQQSLGSHLFFTAYSFLKAIGRNTSGASHQWLKDSITRLKANAVEIKHDHYTYAGSLIDEFFREEEQHKYAIKLNKNLRDLFENYTYIDFQQRLALRTHPLAQWLHGFYSSHHKPFPLKISTIKELCGSQCEEAREFKRSLDKALGELCRITGWQYQLLPEGTVVLQKTDSAVR